MEKKCHDKGVKCFKDIWNSGIQAWTVPYEVWQRCSRRERTFLAQTISRIRDNWPTAPFVATSPQLKDWAIAGIPVGRKVKVRIKEGKWIQRVMDKWSKIGCKLTIPYCRKLSAGMWGSTGSGRLDMLLWRILHQKLPVRAITAKWGDGNTFCPRCKSMKETLRHALWECKEVHPTWKRLEKLLINCGVNGNLTWRQAVLGCKGRMSPGLYKIWHPIRARMLSEIW